jgi:hypothetical protein
MKREMAKTLAGQAVPEYAVRAGQGLSAALARASQYEPFRGALGLRAKEPMPPEESMSGIAADAPVVVSRMRDGKAEIVEGKFISSDPDWLVIQTKDGRMHIPQRQVGEILERK